MGAANTPECSSETAMTTAEAYFAVDLNDLRVCSRLLRPTGGKFNTSMAWIEENIRKLLSCYIWKKEAL